MKSGTIYICILAGMLVCFSAGAQSGKTRTISGIVYDEDNEPMTGVFVSGQGTDAGGLTDNTGEFMLAVPDTVKFLDFSMLGYRELSMALTGKDFLEVFMEPSDIQLDEVIVIGYGTATKKDFTGSVGTVSVQDIAKAPVASLSDALAGRIAGVNISTSDGQPGQSANIVIRGAGSMTQTNAPLWVVDRVPMEDFDPSSISTEDIASISVLKDASAIAIYGARAANGVIVLTTKRGTSGKTIVDFSVKAGFPRITRTIEMMDAYEYVRYLNEYDPDRARRLYFNDGMTLEDYRNVDSIDWQKEILKKNPVTQIYDFSVYGGNNAVQYRASASYYDQDGILDNSGYSSLRGRVMLDVNLYRNLKMGITISGSRHEDYGQLVASDGINTTTLTNLLYRVWAYRPYSPNGNLMEEFIDDDMFSNNDFRINPILSNANEYNRRIRKDISASVTLEYKLGKNLTFFVMGAMNTRDSSSESFNNSLTVNGSPYNYRNTRGQWGSVSGSERTILTNENTISYRKSIRQHVIDAVAGLSFERGDIKSNGFTATNVPNEELGISGLGMGIPYQTSYSSSYYTMMSAFARLNYSFGSRYLFTVTMRADGSSKFAPGHKWGYFPSGAFAWNVKEESFMKHVRPVSTLKLRLSYGVTGNNRIGYFDYIASMATSINNDYSFGGDTPSTGTGLNKLGNPGLKWESTAQFDAGLEFGMFKDRILIEADIYNKRTYDLLLNSQIPSQSGYTYAMQNVGEIRNYGLELSLTTRNIETRSFTWTSQFNISFNRNKVLKLNNNASNRLDFPRFQTTYNNTPLYITEVGKPIGMFYGLKFDGIYQYDDFTEKSDGIYVLKPGIPDNGAAVNPGYIKYRDMNGDGTINDYDRVVIGNPNPVHTGGFNNNFTYQSMRWGTVSLNIFLQWSYGNDVFNANRLVFEGNGLSATGLNQYASYADRWTPENPSNTLFSTKGGGPQGYISDRTLEDGSFLRLKTLELSYGFPQRLLRKAKVFRSISVNFAAQNLFTWTNYSGLDPEVSTMNSVLTPGFDFCAYPRARVFTFGFRLRF